VAYCREWMVAMWYLRYRKEADGMFDCLGLLRKTLMYEEHLFDFVTLTHNSKASLIDSAVRRTLLYNIILPCRFENHDHFKAFDA